MVPVFTNGKPSNGSLTTEVMNGESITVTVHQTIEERDEQERASDLNRIRMNGHEAEFDLKKKYHLGGFFKI